MSIDKKNTTPLTQHKKEGKKLIPPFLSITGMQYKSWVNERLPEMLWAILLITNLDRDHALDLFRGVAGKFAKLTKEEGLKAQDTDVTMSALAGFPRKEAIEILKEVFNDDKVQRILRPILLFDKLPGFDMWKEIISTNADENEDWRILSSSVNKNLFHQSQEATDCRWVKVLFMILSRKIQFPEGMRDTMEGILDYPIRGDMRRIRPSIRAMEIGTDMQNDKSWANEFWNQCLKRTNCIGKANNNEVEPRADEYREKFIKRYKSLTDSFFETQKTSAVDSRRETIFGMALYASNLFTQCVAFEISSYSLSRLALRSLAEMYITLSYLLKKDEQKLWDEFRVYGTGQAKLSLEKLEDNPPSYINIQSIDEIANEDAWIEFVPVNLGHWDSSNLRKISESIGLKDIYTRYYEWTSEFMHGNWGAMREVVYQTCMNPLHRLHRIPVVELRPLTDSSEDLYFLWEKIIEIAEKEYPPVNKNK